MKLQEILENRGIDLSKTKIIRHNLTSKEVSGNLELGYLDLFQSIQSPNEFSDCNTIISFLGTEGTNGVLLGCYRIEAVVPYNKQLLPPDFIDDNPKKERVFYKMVKIDELSDMENRLEIDWGKGAIVWCQNGTTEKKY